jgi:tetratricopeptide (TPR) repeat protein
MRSVAHVAVLGAVVAWTLAATLPAAAESSNGSGQQERADEAKADERYVRLLEKGRAAYNNENYQKAADAYRKAAQASPDRPEAYRNLARTYFWREQYARAGVHYDYYLKLVPSEKDVSKVKRERKLAADRAGDDVWQLPDSQKRVLKALREALTDGKAYTEGGGGAWALYEALLRTGYVAPELDHIQDRLRKKLVDEFEGLVVTDGSQPVPVLSLEEWQRQQMRLEAARSVADEPDLRTIIDRRMGVAETALALLNGRHNNAAKLAADAIEQNPDMPFLWWYRSTALVEAGRPEQARRALERFEEKTEAGQNGENGYIEVLRAVLNHRTGETEEAADTYRRLLEN